MRAGVMATFTIICAIIAWMDIQKQKIYNEAVAVLFVPAIVSFFVYPEISVVSRFFGAVSVSGIMLLVSLISPGAFGGGDIKLMIPVGLFLGWERTLVAGAIALTLEGMWALWIILKSIRGNRLPFAPALCLGSVAALLWGEQIWQWIIEIS